MVKRMLSVGVGMAISTAHGLSRVEEIVTIKRETEKGVTKERKIVLRDENGNVCSMTLEDQGCKSLIMSICGELSEVPAGLASRIENTGSRIKKGWENLVARGKAHCSSCPEAN